MNLAPILLFTFNRPLHTARTLQALAENHMAADSELFIFSDGPRDERDKAGINEVRELLHSLSGFKRVELRESKTNQGLANSVIKGVSEIIKLYGRAIVVEDDLVTSPYFLSYMNRALDFYAGDERVMHISGYNYPLEWNSTDETYFLNVVCPWGWATWERAWKHFIEDPKEIEALLKKKDSYSLESFNRGFGTEFTKQLEENINGWRKTWAVRWHASVYLHDGYVLYPTKSLCSNIGFDDSGTNCSSNDPFYVEIHDRDITRFNAEPAENQEGLLAFKSFYHRRYNNENIMNDSGERLLTYFFEYWTLEHLHRYSLAFDFVKGKTVLDIASGEGYGSNLLAGYAKKVTGIDISGETVGKAREKYYRDNLEYLEGSIMDIPLPDNSVDVVVSYETLEHVEGHEKVFSEIRRVLKDDGLLIISTPDKENYTIKPGYNNPFHVKELFFDEFRELVSKYFPYSKYYLQTTVYGSILLSEEDTAAPFAGLQGDFESISTLDRSELREYSICIASAKEFKAEIPNSYFHGREILKQKLKSLEEKVKHLEEMNRVITSTRMYRLSDKIRKILKP